MQWLLNLVGQKARGRCLLAAFAVALLEVLRRRRTRPQRVAILKDSYFLGNLRDIIRATLDKEQQNFFWSIHKLLGKTWAVKLPMTPWMIFTTSVQNVKHVLKDNFDNYPKGPSFQSPLKQLLGDGIFIADGPSWHSQRKTSSLMFTAKKFKDHIWTTVRRNARKLRDCIEAAEPGQKIDVYNLMNRFTLDTIGEIGFGKCIGSLENPTSPFLLSFDKTQQISFHRFFMPGWQLLRFFRLGTEQQSHVHFTRIDKYSRDVARELCESISRDSKDKSNGVTWADIQGSKSFVGMFLADAEARGEKLSEDFLRDLVLNFLLAGRDTTAHALSWTFYCLSLHPEVEEKARQEIKEVCGVRGPAYEDMGNLPYLQAIVSEVLRIYPSVPVDVKTAVHDDTLPDGTVVRKGNRIVYNMFSMGRDKSIWGEDAEKFRPERWLEMKEMPSNYEYPVFNAGPRECLGRRLALVEMKACLATLLPHVSLRLAVPPDQICTDAQLTIGMGRGLPCYVDRLSGDEEDPGSNSSTAAPSDTAGPSDSASVGSGEGGLALERDG